MAGRLPYSFLFSCPVSWDHYNRLLDGSTYIADLVAEKRRHPGDDLLSQLARMEAAGDHLDEHELRAMVGLLIFAGHETTANLISIGVLTLFENAVHADPPHHGQHGGPGRHRWDCDLGGGNPGRHIGWCSPSRGGQTQQIGFGIAGGILMDTFLIRTLFIPTVVVLLGRWNW